MFKQVFSQHRFRIADVCVIPIQVVLLDLLQMGRDSIDMGLRGIFIGVKVTLQNKRIFASCGKLVFLPLLAVLRVLIHIEADSAYEKGYEERNEQSRRTTFLLFRCGWCAYRFFLCLRFCNIPFGRFRNCRLCGVSCFIQIAGLASDRPMTTGTNCLLLKEYLTTFGTSCHFARYLYATAGTDGCLVAYLMSAFRTFYDCHFYIYVSVFTIKIY